MFLIICVFIFIFIFTFLSLAFLYRQRVDCHLAAVVVLGDVGRSPRSMYHALSLLDNGYDVMLVGYKGSTPIEQLENKRVKLCTIDTPSNQRMATRIITQTFSLLSLFLASKRIPMWTLFQTPPAIPTLVVAQLLRIITGTRIIIDWHNTAFSLLALKWGKAHPLVRLSMCIERVAGKVADVHLFVTHAMRIQLSYEWGLTGKKLTLHDKPLSTFKRLSLTERGSLLSRLNLTDDPAFHPSSSDTDVRTALLVTSTSWTPDEDFDMLLSALETYEKAKASSGNSQLPNILLAITGRGPLKQEFEKRVHHLEKTWKCVRVCTVWLEPHDYPKLLGAAHLGLSFHSSSSGLDLPMKVVDMFGAGLPVCALNFACLHELVVDGVNGLTFESGTQLGGQLVDLLASKNKLSNLRDYLAHSADADWQTNWNTHLNVLLE
ncbi:hypothetical protein E3P89_03955 [Wallemia ichthyophaga]|uniref:Chitobiosyldiphosphodolichol beta-mannosyltransferase n=2 Tax=Wallemia ichthyophaga TaxID=245174 RepID=A0A4T0GZL4_WALIC|nr:hypothetical protein E3P93_03971 [Wallemia ichthyophaga]TIB07677.1 hypothetical protein E3P90_03968 [Wallemia ichthyophaga]TIB19444.1 hypothetical protein E3P89_03955 [Wallemia ichthyophaga]TIB20308.1 hypothetical protein E3P88_03974 [Wallemia ichthyophaga]